MNQRGQHQGGWVAQFVIVGALLVIALLGGVYFLKSNQNMFLPDKSDTSQVSKSDQTPTANDDKSSAKKDEKSDTSSKNNASDSKKEKSTSDKSTKSSNKNTDLPHTGPADSALQIVGVSLLAFAVASYVKSRR